jgi:predicted MPP superfamily phosphohydrolase
MDFARHQVRRLVHRSWQSVNVPHELSLESVQLPISNLHPSMEGYRIVQLSDLHLYPLTPIELIARAVDLANSLRPDLVVLTGDYVTAEAEAMYQLEPVIGRLNATDGVFATLGNHDYWSDAVLVRRSLQHAGLTVLHNRSVPLNGGAVWLTGLDDGWAGEADLEAALADTPNDAPVVLLMHEPDLVDQYSLNPRIVAQFSGHTHGGQIRTGKPRRAYTLPYLGRKYDHGLYRVNNTWLYTNRGIGAVIAPIRVNCPSEVTEFTLVADRVPDSSVDVTDK